MFVYRTPSVAAFQKRKLFHATRKEQSESISDWFKRVQQYIIKCDFDSMTEYMLIDKFVSGLNEMDFQKIAKVSNWTLQDIILVVIGNEHIFKTVQIKDSHHHDYIASVHVKCETDLQLTDVENGQNESLSDNLNIDEHTDTFAEVNAEINETTEHTEETSATEQIRLAKCLKNRRHLQKLKETGRYDEYKKKQAATMRLRRQKMKQTEQYLPPELQLHLMNERRRAKRERVKRCRERRSQETMGEATTTEESTAKRKQPAEMAFETIMSEALAESGGEMEPTVANDFDDPIFEPETQLSCEESDPEPKQSNELPKLTKKTAVKKKKSTIKRPSVYKRKRTFECYRCSLACSKLYELKTHINIFHPYEEPKKDLLNCPYCTKTTISRKILSHHLRKNHASLQVHRCPCCDEEFKKRGQLTDHMSQHHRDYRPYICEICANSFRTVSDLNTHRRRHTGQKQARCTICGLQFASRNSIKAHMMIHTGERPYQCNFCEQSFRQTSSLRKHLITVHKQGEKKYVCKTCEKRFASIYHLRIHENIHTGARPYQCDYCGSDFNQPSALKTHVNRVHLNQPSSRQKAQTIE